MEQSNFYAVFIGSKIGVFSTGKEAKAQTESYPDGYYHMYTSGQEVIHALERFLIVVPTESSVSGKDHYSTNGSRAYDFVREDIGIGSCFQRLEDNSCD